MSGNNGLAGRSALVTGGAGAIGSSAAKFLLRDGAAVMLMGRRRDALERTREALLKEVGGGRVDLHPGDGTQAAEVKAALAATHAMANRLDIIIATVGKSSFRPLLLEDEESYRTAFTDNLLSTFLAVRHGAPLMQPGGAIVAISSTSGTMPFNGLSAYCTMKAALEMFVRSAAEELGEAGIRVNAVRPGLTRKSVDTAMFKEPLHAKFIAEMPLGRTGYPDDIGAAVRYLAGPEAAWVTGQSFAIDGGQETRKNPNLSDYMDGVYGKDVMAQIRKGRPPQG